MAKLHFKGPPKVTNIAQLALRAQIYGIAATLGWTAAVILSVILVLGRH